MLSKILVPVDGSDNSFRALEHAIFLSIKIQESQITVLYIIEDLPTVYIYSPKTIEKLHADYKSESAKILERCKELASKSWNKHSHCYSRGRSCFQNYCL